MPLQQTFNPSTGKDNGKDILIIVTIPQSQLQVGDRVRLSNAPFSDAMVMSIADGLVHLCRPFVYSIGTDVFGKTGVEDFAIHYASSTPIERYDSRLQATPSTRTWVGAMPTLAFEGKRKEDKAQSNITADGIATIYLQGVDSGLRRTEV